MSHVKHSAFARAARPIRTALVTEELSSLTGAGGIGAAFHELALALARHGHEVELLFLPTTEDKTAQAALAQLYSALGIRLTIIPLAEHVWPPFTAERKAYAILCHLRALETGFDYVHFHDYKGLAFYCLAAKRQGMGFPATQFIVQLHGPTRWTLEANAHPFTHDDQLKIDFMERACVEGADTVVSPSQYMLDWMGEKGWKLPAAKNVHVIQNVCTELHGRAARLTAAAPRGRVEGFQEIIFFGRHEERKGLAPFCDAIDRLHETLADRGITVTFLGRFGEINDSASALYLATRSKGWTCQLQLLPDFGRNEAARYLAAQPRALVVVASPFENSPYTVLETIVLGKPLITSRDGGAAELLDARSAASMTCAMDGPSLAAKIACVLQEGSAVPLPRHDPAVTEQAWVALHARPRARAQAARKLEAPRVTVGIVHHDRPEKLVEALLSIAAQTYRNIDIVIVDDGSRQPQTLAALQQIQPLLDKLGARLLRQENLYLGAARNHIIRESTSDYLLFLDDDDIAFPTLVQSLVTASLETGAAVVNCLNLFMEVTRRADAFPFPDRFEQKPSYFPLGGPISLAALENCFGAATALMRRDALADVGGYTELHGVGHEDYELYVRMVQRGHRIEICPLPLYLYEVGRPSMISTTSRQRNFHRVAVAVDPREFPAAACADVMSLLAGKRAAEHTANFRQYILSIDPQGDLLRSIQGTAENSTAYCELLARYATARGAGALAAAFTTLAAKRAAPAAGLEGGAAPLLSPIAPRTAAPPRIGNPLVLGAVIDLECNRLQPAIAALSLLLDRDEDVGPDMVRLLQRLVHANCRGLPEAERFIARIASAPIADGVFSAAAAPLFALALQMQQPDLAGAIAARALTLDEAAYLAAHQDVARAIAQGQVPSGIAHMATHKEEGRGGFSLTTGLCATLRRETAANVAPEALARHLALLVSPSPAPSPLAMDHAA